VSTLKELGRERGRAAAFAALANNLPAVMEREMHFTATLFPSLGADFDLAAGVLAYDRERLHAVPSLGKFPETRGLIERVLGEREGFLESSRFAPVHAAFHYSWRDYIWKRINAHHVARYDVTGARSQCTNVFFPDGKDGVTTADNRDDILRPQENSDAIAHYRVQSIPDCSVPHWRQGAVSSMILLDDEPENSFPYDPYEFIPDECFDDIEVLVSYLDARRDFWGPGNQIWVDRHLNAVAVEKSNCRAAYRFPEKNGAVCITAGSYLDPALNAFKRARFTEVAYCKGESADDSADLKFSEGCDVRHRRLWELTAAEAARPGGATLWGAFEIVADTAMPFPARVCLAGEKSDPRDADANWTLTQNAVVITGPHRRALFRSLQNLENPRPIYHETPKLVLGNGVAMQPEWQADIDNGRCVLFE
jgi:hypothetical protein